MQPFSHSYREGEFNRREYHGITRGWILNEIVRRVDTKGRTIGEILRADICEPLGGIGAYIGLSMQEMPRVTRVENPSMGFYLKQSLIPQAFGRKLDMNFFELVSAFVSYCGCCCFLWIVIVLVSFLFFFFTIFLQIFFVSLFVSLSFGFLLVCFFVSFSHLSAPSTPSGWFYEASWQLHEDVDETRLSTGSHRRRI